MISPLVSICCITYNHENFIRQCLDGFLMQKTNFDFEILIHDDASTDNNQEIIKEYEGKYPQIFKCVYQKKNQFGIQNTLTNILLKMASGKYVALCEGDDYWSDPLKLQKQVDFLEANPDYSFCGHGTNKLESETLTPIKGKILGKVKINDAVYQYVTQTSSLLFRHDLLKPFPQYFHKSPVGDAAFICVLLSKAPGYILNDYMSVYRVHGGGVHTGAKLFQNQLTALRTQLWKMRYFPVNLWKQMEKAYIILWHMHSKGVKWSSVFKPLHNSERILTFITLVLMTHANIFMKKQRRVGN